MLPLATVTQPTDVYKFSFPNKLIIEVPQRIVMLFETLSNMIDFGANSEELKVPIPIPDWVDPDAFQWAVEAYLIIESRTKACLPIDTLEDLYSDIKAYNRLLVSFHPQAKQVLLLFGSEVPTTSDLETLFQLAKTVDWLYADLLLKLVMNKIYELVNTFTTDELRALSVLTTRKRKAETKSPPCGELPPLTPFYTREELIRDFLMQELKCSTLVRANRAHQKHIDPIAVSLYNILFLREDGSLDLYDRTDSVYSAKKLKVVPPSGRVLLIESMGSSLVCLTSSGLYIYRTIMERRLREWTAIFSRGEILTLACGDNHMMVLTTEGLFAYGDNKMGQLGVATKHGMSYYTYLTRITDINRAEIRHIYCGAYSTFIVTTRGIFAAGDNTVGQLSVASTEQKVFEFEPVINVVGSTSLRIAADENYTLFLTKERLCVVGDGRNTAYGNVIQPDRFCTKIELPGDMPMLVNVYQSLTYSIISTGAALYAIGLNEDGQLATRNQKEQTVYVKMLGVEGLVYSVKPLARSVLIYTSKGLYQSGFPLGLPFVSKFRPNELAMVFKKIDIDLGYFKKPCLANTTIIEIDDDEIEETGEPERKIQRFQCNYCSGDCHYFTGHFTVCSKTCLVNLTQ